MSIVFQQSKTHSTIPSSAYIHLPFCRSRCYYCDFPITVIGHQIKNQKSILIEQYIEILVQEIKITPPLGLSLDTVFFGGGTPSLLPIEYLELILQILDQRFGINTNAEISIEIDPGTFTLQKLMSYQHFGVNRFSLGVQAFQDELLQICGRSHSYNDIITALDLMEKVGINNFSLDLISGLPNQTLNQWQESLTKAINIAPQHISCYDLVLEPVTVFGHKYQPGNNPLPEDETTANMYRLASEMLKDSGYEHYEISNYAKPSYQCRHNRIYWENLPYYGFGMGAASYTNNQRFTRPRTREAYKNWVTELTKTEGIINYPQTSSQDRLLETLMLGLRLTEGINLTKISQAFGADTVNKILEIINPYQHQGWVEIDLVSEGYIRLNDPEGLLFSNWVLTELFHKLS